MEESAKRFRNFVYLAFLVAGLLAVIVILPMTYIMKRTASVQEQYEACVLKTDSRADCEKLIHE